MVHTLSMIVHSNVARNVPNGKDVSVSHMTLKTTTLADHLRVVEYIEDHASLC